MAPPLAPPRETIDILRQPLFGAGRSVATRLLRLGSIVAFPNIGPEGWPKANSPGTVSIVSRRNYPRRRFR
jgi:hypothetical protein